jgi:hypothetical protein
VYTWQNVLNSKAQLVIPFSRSSNDISIAICNIIKMFIDEHQAILTHFYIIYFYYGVGKNTTFCMKLTNYYCAKFLEIVEIFYFGKCVLEIMKITSN